MALGAGSGVFKCGIAVAPVSSWMYYGENNIYISWLFIITIYNIIFTPITIKPFYPSARIGLRGIVVTGVVRVSVRASFNFWFLSISRRTPCPIKSIFAGCVGAG